MILDGFPGVTCNSSTCSVPGSVFTFPTRALSCKYSNILSVGFWDLELLRSGDVSNIDSLRVVGADFLPLCGVPGPLYAAGLFFRGSCFGEVTADADSSSVAADFAGGVGLGGSFEGPVLVCGVILDGNDLVGGVALGGAPLLPGGVAFGGGALPLAIEGEGFTFTSFV